MRRFNAIFILCFFISVVTHAGDLRVFAQDDTVKAFEALTIPTIDGKADDLCWENAQWQSIDAEWIVWGQDMNPADFTGRYKTTWSSETDRMYFLIEITDNVLVKGYKYPMNGYWDWDGIEIFFDEDASGGDHKLNQNAFAYHITYGNDDDAFEAMDLTANWEVVNYSNHLECIIENDAGIYTWEISMIVYNEEFVPGNSNNPIEQLEVGRVSGLTLAYNDNDNPDEEPKLRDNFIGSVAVPQANFNDHWMNADWFGKVKLVANNPLAIIDQSDVISNFNLKQNYPNPFNPETTIEYITLENEHVLLTIYDIRGREMAVLVDTFQNAGTYLIKFDGSKLASGIYFAKLKAGTNLKINKMILSK